LGALCFILCGGVIALRIFWPVVRVAVAHQPISKVDTGDRADCDGPLLLVAINFGALDGAMGNESVKVVRGFLPATIVLANFVPAKLIGLERINAPQANGRPVDFQRVAVDDARLPGEVIGRRRQGRR
jgi:hypothetical protein